MRLTRNLKRSVVALATLGLLVQNAGLSLAATQDRVGQVRDVALKAGGVLTGEIRGAQGAVHSRIPVTVSKDGRTVAMVMTDEKGQFAAPGLQSGVYVVSAPGTQGLVVRAWPAPIAPPAAAPGILFVAQGDVVNGGAPIGLGALGIGAVVLGAIVAVAAVAASNDNNSSGSVSAPISAS